MVDMEVFQPVVVGHHDMISQLLHDGKIPVTQLKVWQSAETVGFMEHANRMDCVPAFSVTKSLQELWRLQASIGRFGLGWSSERLV